MVWEYSMEIYLRHKKYCLIACFGEERLTRPVSFLTFPIASDKVRECHGPRVPYSHSFVWLDKFLSNNVIFSEKSEIVT